MFFNIRFSYLKGRIMETDSTPTGLLPQMTTVAMVAQAKVRLQELRRNPHEWQIPKLPQAILYCFPRHINRELAQKQSSWDWNWCSSLGCLHLKEVA